MDLEQLENEARAAALKEVSKMLQRPDQLERIDQYGKKYARHKVSLESNLKSALQGQFDSVKNGLAQLEGSLEHIGEIRKTMAEISEVLQKVPALHKRLAELREEQASYGQYQVAMDNMKHIFTVPDSLERAQQAIQEGKLLNAHQSLMELEGSRDDLLYELHRVPDHDKADEKLLEHYFSGVQKLSSDLSKQLWLILSRMMTTVQREPTTIVTALRIVEREEAIDAKCIKRNESSGFMPPGRPKRWKKKAFEVIKDLVSRSIESNQVQNREQNKMWIVLHLELLRKMTLTDIKIMKNLVVPCFPPHYDICKCYTRMYHESLGNHLKEVIQLGLEGNEFVSVLQWVLNTYPDIMKALDINPHEYGPLLDSSVINDLERTYIKNTNDNLSKWLPATLDTAVKGWRSSNPPDADEQNCHRTTVPLDVTVMVEQNITVAKTIRFDTTAKMLDVCIDQVVQVLYKWKNEVLKYKNECFQDRSQYQWFTHYMVANVNDALEMAKMGEKLKRQHWPPEYDTHKMKPKFEKLKTIGLQLRDDAAGMLLEEPFVDLEMHFVDVFSKNWLESTIAVETICVTMEDYFSDYRRLTQENLIYVALRAQRTIAIKYMTAMLGGKRYVPKTQEDRTRAGQKVCGESLQMKSTFAKLSLPVGTEATSPFDCLKAIGEILKVADCEFIALELIGMVKRYPDLSVELLTAILNLRGDMSRSEMRERAADAIMEGRKEVTGSPAKTVFSEVTLPPKILTQIFGIES